MHRRLLLCGLAAILVGTGCFNSSSSSIHRSRPVVEEPEATPEKTEPADPSAVVPISFDDLNLPMEPDSAFESWMLTQRVRDLDGKRVRISGFMCAGSIFTLHHVKNFMLLREKECPYGPGGQAHHVIDVELSDSTIDFTTAAITLEGVLTVKPFTGANGKTWAVYHLAGKKIE